MENKLKEALKKLGIETAEQYKVLEGMKVRLVQGYYFDKPMTKDNFEIKYLRY